MTDEEKKRMIQAIQDGKPEEEDPADDWTTEDILAAAHRIMERLGIDGKLE